MKSNDLITVADAAEIIGVNDSRIRQLIRAGQLPARRMGERLYLIERSAAEKFRRTPPGPRPKKSGK